MPATAQPAVGADWTLYLPSTNGALYALGNDTGSPLWTLSPPATAVFSPITPAVDDVSGTVFYASDAVYALNGLTGAIIWKWNASLPPLSFGALLLGPVDAESLYVVVEGSGLVALNATSGEELWSLLGSVNDISLSPDGSVIYGIAGRSSVLFAIDSTSGALLWTNPNAPAVYSAPIVTSQGLLVFLAGTTLSGSSYLNFTVFNPSTQSITVTTAIQLPACVGGTVSISEATLVFSTTVVFAYGCTSGYVAGGLAGISLASGTLLWSTTNSQGYPGFSVGAAPIAGADSTVYTGASNGTVYAINAGTGATLWSIDTNSPAGNFVPFAAIAGDRRLSMGNCIFQ
jgi:outer membrane protein assembly factor BamB